jgi:hypothetical protein
MAGEVQKQQVIQRAVREERRYLPPDDRFGFVQQQAGLEVPDVRVAQHTRERVRIARRPTEPGELWVTVGATGDDQSTSNGRQGRAPHRIQ